MTRFVRRMISGGVAAVLVAAAAACASTAPAPAPAPAPAAATPPSPATASATVPEKPFEPRVGQPGKDVVWVPTPPVTVDAMLNLAKLTKDDFLVDLGSGDGITVITAAKRGARAMGVEFNPDMVALAEQRTIEAGMTARATFKQGDFFKTDFSQANVLTMFLLPSLNEALRPTILNMKPGTRVVTNTFRMGSGDDEWLPESEQQVDSCTSSWCTAILYVVPAKIEGAWKMDTRTLTFTQKYTRFSGSLGTTAITEGKVLGNDITFTAGATKYAGTVSADGKTIKGANWSATR